MSSGCVRSRAMMTGSGCRLLKARSSVAWLIPFVSASLRTAPSQSSKLTAGVGAGAGVATGVGGVVWVGGGGGGSCRAAAAAVHRHATSAPTLTSRMLNSILNPLGGNRNRIVYRLVHDEHSHREGSDVSLAGYSSSSFTSPRSAFDAAMILPCR